MASVAGARAEPREPAGPRLWLLLTLLVSSCGGQAESPTTAGAPSPTPRSGRATPALPNPGLSGLSLPPPEETCAENPLLAMCQPPVTGVPTPSVPPENTPALDLRDPSLAPIERAEAILSARCGSCHGTANPLVCGVCDGLNDIDDMGKMIELGKIIPCRWTDSQIYQRIARGEMPPASTSQPPPTRQELAILANFVNGLCAELTSGDAFSSGRAAIESWLAQDCASCHGQAPANADAGAAARVPVLDLSELVEGGVIVPCNPEGSLLVQRLSDNSMPPPGVSPRPTARELRELVTFIERPCSRR